MPAKQFYLAKTLHDLLILVCKAMFCDFAKRSNIAWQANIECLKANDRSPWA